MTDQDSKLMRELTPDDLKVEAILDEALDCVVGGAAVDYFLRLGQPSPGATANILVI